MKKIKALIKENCLFSLLSVFWILGYFLSRLFHLTIIPVFVDEAIYIRWAQVMRAVNTLRFLPLSDGKQPLFMWLIMPFLKIIADPLVAGRLVSVLAGLGAMAGIFVLSFLLFKKKEVAFLASLLYLISPFTFFFDRLALADGLLSSLGVWVMVGAVALGKEKRLDIAMITGILLGLALITKSPALFFALLLPTGIILSEHITRRPANLLRLFFLWGVVYLFALAIYNILRLGPEFQMIAVRNKDYVFSLVEILAHPLNPLWDNLKNSLEWFWILLTPLSFAAAIVGGILVLRRQFKEGVFLWLWFLFPLLSQSAVAKVYTSRYILFTVPVLLIFAAYFLAVIFFWLKNKILTILVLTIFFIWPTYQIGLLLTNPQKAWLPAKERNGYLEIWTAGYGIKEAADYLKEVAKKEKVLVGTEGFFGTLPDGLQSYVEGMPNITVIGLGQPIGEVPGKLTDSLKDNRVFLLVNDSRLRVVDRQNLRLINQYPKAESQDGTREQLLFFEVMAK